MRLELLVHVSWCKCSFVEKTNFRVFQIHFTEYIKNGKGTKGRVLTFMNYLSWWVVAKSEALKEILILRGLLILQSDGPNHALTLICVAFFGL